jgi:hypothetical protein
MHWLWQLVAMSFIISSYINHVIHKKMLSIDFQFGIALGRQFHEVHAKRISMKNLEAVVKWLMLLSMSICFQFGKNAKLL